MLVLQLIEQGKLSFDGTASDYLPYFPPIKRQHLTIHRLLSHTTGLPHYEGIRRLGMAYDEFRKTAIKPKEFAKLISSMALIRVLLL